MVAVVEQLGGALGESGLLVLPCVAAHINQVSHVLIHYHFAHLADCQLLNYIADYYGLFPR